MSGDNHDLPNDFNITYVGVDKEIPFFKTIFVILMYGLHDISPIRMGGKTSDIPKGIALQENL